MSYLYCGNMFQKLLLVVIGLIPATVSMEEYLDINELFPSFQQLPAPDLPPELYKNISIDIEKINIDKFKTKLEDEMLKNAEVEFDPKDLESGRRYAISFDPTQAHKHRLGVIIATNLVGVDIILQMVYMAKGQMMAVESSTFFDTRNTAYRVGFLGFQTKKDFTKLLKIYTYMRKYAYSFYEMRGHIVLHHRAVKLHVDMIYYHWVMVVLDGLYRDANGEAYKPQLPNSEKATGGISIPYDGKNGFLFRNVHSSGDIPKAHVPVLERLITKYLNTTPARQASIADLLFGDGSAADNLENLDVNHLNRAMLKSLIEAESAKMKAKAVNEAKSRRQLWEITPQKALQNERDIALFVKIFDLMKQSIYGVRYRLAETKLLRLRYRENERYNIGIIVSNVYQLILRTEVYLDHMYRLPSNVFMLWHLIAYEKILANSIDVEDLVKRAFLYQKMHKDKVSELTKPEDEEKGSTEMVKFPQGKPTPSNAPEKTVPFGLGR